MQYRRPGDDFLSLMPGYKVNRFDCLVESVKPSSTESAG